MRTTHTASSRTFVLVFAVGAIVKIERTQMFQGQSRCANTRNCFKKDGEPPCFRSKTDENHGCMWHVCPGVTDVKISRRIQKLVADVERDPTPKNFPDRMIFMNMRNDIDLNGAAEEQMCISNSQRDVDFLQDFTIQIIGASLGPGLSSLGTTTRLKALEKSGTRLPKVRLTSAHSSQDMQFFRLRDRQTERRSQKAANRHLCGLG